MFDAEHVSTPTRYGVLLAIMREYGWSWTDIQDTPADMIEEIAIRLDSEQHWQAERSRRDAQMNEARNALSR